MLASDAMLSCHSVLACGFILPPRSQPCCARIAIPCGIDLTPATECCICTGVVSFAGTDYQAGRRWARQAIDVSIVAGSVQSSRDGQVIRVHPIRHDRARELGAFANPKAAPAARTPPSALSSSYRNSPVADPGRVRYCSAGGSHRLRTCSQSASSGDSAGAMYRAPGKVCAGGVKLPRAMSRSMFAR